MPAAIIPVGAIKPFDCPRDKPLLGPGQGLDFEPQRYFIDASHEFSRKLSATLRCQHQYTDITAEAYSFFGINFAGEDFSFTDPSRKGEVAEGVGYE